MDIKDRLKKVVKFAFASAGLGVVQLRANRSFMNCAFQSIVERKHNIQTVIDVGASDGRWSEEFMEYAPEAHYLLIEAQALHEEGLKTFCRRHPKGHYVLAAAGEKTGTLYFDANNPFGGQASYTPYEKSEIVPMVSVDQQVDELHLPGPYLLKLDTHGFEVPILKGAQAVLAQTEVIIMECYNFKIASECLTFDEMCQYLKTYGFRCIDLVDPVHRPHDHAFWQMDLVFVKADRPEFQYTKYR